MRVPNRPVAAAVAAVLLLVGAGRATADPYHNADYKFNLTLPDGWRAMAAAELKQVNAVVGQLLGGAGVKYVAGFRPVEVVPGKSPYVLVQVDKDVAGMSFEDFRKEYNKNLSAARSAMSGVTFDNPVYDTERKCIICRGTVGQGAAKVGVKSVGYLGPDGAVVLHCYAPEADFKSHESTFTRLTTMFHFDGQELPGHKAEQPAPGADLRDRLGGLDLGENGRMVIIGGATVVLVLIVGWFVVREKPDRRRPAF
jgi:hypothetical protein